jgi:hypothetical protein
MLGGALICGRHGLFGYAMMQTQGCSLLGENKRSLSRRGADLGIRSMNQQLRIVTIRIENFENGGVRAWSDDLAGLSLTCPNHEVLFAELPLKIASLLEQQGFNSKIVREIHQFVVEVSAIQG